MGRPPLLLLLMTIGCTPDRMIGFIDGREWAVSESYMVLEPEAFGEDDLLAINLSSLPDPCRTWQLWEALAVDAEGPEDLAEAWKEVFPQAFWEVHVGARLRPATWPVGNTGWAGIEWDEIASAPELAFAVFVEHRDYRPASFFDTDEPLEDLEEIEVSYTSHAGALKWRQSTPGRSAKGRFNTDVVDDEANRLGRVTLSFNATPCAVAPPILVVPPPEDDEESTTSSTD